MNYSAYYVKKLPFQQGPPSK